VQFQCMNEVVAYLEGLNAPLVPQWHTPAIHNFQKQPFPQQAPCSDLQSSCSGRRTKAPSAPTPPVLSIPLLSAPLLSKPNLSQPLLSGPHLSVPSRAYAPESFLADLEPLLVELYELEPDESEPVPDQLEPQLPNKAQYCKAVQLQLVPNKVTSHHQTNAPLVPNPHLTPSVSAYFSPKFLKSSSASIACQFELQPPRLQIPQLRAIPSTQSRTPEQTPQSPIQNPHNLPTPAPSLHFNFQIPESRSNNPLSQSFPPLLPHTSHFRVSSKAKSNKFDYTKEFQSAFHALLKANEKAKVKKSPRSFTYVLFSLHCYTFLAALILLSLPFLIFLI
jgi:hypothetical protein